MYDFSKFKITDEQRDRLVIESLKDDYLFLRKQISSFMKKETTTDLDHENHCTDCINVVHVFGVLKYYMNHQDLMKFLQIVKIELDSKT